MTATEPRVATGTVVLSVAGRAYPSVLPPTNPSADMPWSTRNAGDGRIGRLAPSQTDMQCGSVWPARTDHRQRIPRGVGRRSSRLAA